MHWLMKKKLLSLLLTRYDETISSAVFVAKDVIAALQLDFTRLS